MHYTSAVSVVGVLVPESVLFGFMRYMRRKGFRQIKNSQWHYVFKCHDGGLSGVFHGSHGFALPNVKSVIIYGDFLSSRYCDLTGKFHANLEM